MIRDYMLYHIKIITGIVCFFLFSLMTCQRGENANERQNINDCNFFFAKFLMSFCLLSFHSYNALSSKETFPEKKKSQETSKEEKYSSQWNWNIITMSSSFRIKVCESNRTGTSIFCRTLSKNHFFLGGEWSLRWHLAANFHTNYVKPFSVSFQLGFPFNQFVAPHERSRYTNSIRSHTVFFSLMFAFLFVIIWRKRWLPR